MSDIVEKVFLIGKGLDKKAREFVDGLAEEGKKKVTDLPTREETENKLVERGTRFASVAISQLRKDKEKVEGKVVEAVQGLLERFNVVTRDDMDVIEKMASKAREKVDLLEKRVKELEKELK